jgi:hypothetical protein
LLISRQPVRRATGYLLRTARTPATSINENPTSTPGKYPARNSAVIDTPPLANENTMRMLLGGMMRPVVAAVMFTAAPKLRS